MHRPRMAMQARMQTLILNVVYLAFALRHAAETHLGSKGSNGSERLLVGCYSLNHHYPAMVTIELARTTVMLYQDRRLRCGVDGHS